MNSLFKTHGSLTLINVAYNRAALSVPYVIELLKYSHRKINDLYVVLVVSAKAWLL